jgi:phosphate transport system substrate-binding protein
MKYYSFLAIMLLTACSQSDRAIAIKGSDTEVNLSAQLAESFHTINPTIFISVSGGGSGLGIASLINGTTDIANSSRSIKPEEIALFKKQGIAIDSFVFAQDAIAFVVSDASTIDSISPTILAQILSGKYKNWQPITGKNIPINIYGRQSNSGTHDFVKQKLGIDFSPYAKEMNGNAQILEAIKTDASGIGYVGAGYVANGGSKGIKVLTIYQTLNTKAISPLDAGMIATGSYFFQRPLFQYYKKEVFGNIKPILDYEKSDAGKLIIKAAGYYPVKE